MHRSDDENYIQEKCCSAIEAIGDFYWEYDVVSEIFSFSPSFTTLLGYALQTKISYEEWSTLIHPNDWQTHNDFYVKFLRGEIENYLFEFRIGNQHGEYVTLRERGVIFAYDDNGDALKVIGTHSIISQLSFKNPHDNLHAVVEYGDHLIWEIDRKGYFTYVSKHVQKSKFKVAGNYNVATNKLGMATTFYDFVLFFMW
ncbi:MAG: PAS domain-containing protein, partial [Campylobacterota bacterium]|nr:PAS domain-containing protein [Campylobacterota bacterium]